MAVPRAFLALAWALALASAHPLTHSKAEAAEGGEHYGAEPYNNSYGAEPHSKGYGAEILGNDTALLELCRDNVTFDAATVTENETLLLFRGHEVWVSSPLGSPPQPQPLAHMWPQLGTATVSAALTHNHSLFLISGDQVWAFAMGQLRPGYPRPIGQEFPGIPGGVDAAVECPPEDCGAEVLLFFKGSLLYSLDVSLRASKARRWLPSPCSAALRWRSRYLCLGPGAFRRFLPRTGHSLPGYPRDPRHYLLPCPGRGHGNGSWGAWGDPCSQAPVQALLRDQYGHLQAFRGPLSFQLLPAPQRLHPWPVTQLWPGLPQEHLDAAFTWEGKAYLVQGSQVSVFLLSRGPQLAHGYPRALQEELGVPSADATFLCPNSSTLHVISGSHLWRVSLVQSPRRAEDPQPLPHTHVDAATCTPEGILLLAGSQYHQYQGLGELLGARQPAPPQSIAAGLFRCPQ